MGDGTVKNQRNPPENENRNEMILNKVEIKRNKIK